jgi:Carboxypeptidase regulatory-like domain
MRFARRLTWAVSAVVVVAAGPLFSQVAISGKITGFVTDSSGAGVGGATISVSGPALMAQREAKTQADGSFLFDQLPIGTYDLKAGMSGFKELLQHNIVLTAGFTATLNLKLEVGDLSQSVTVEAAQPLIDVKSDENATTFGTSLLQNVPSGRDPWSTVAQIPGASLSTFDVGGSQMYQQSTMQIHGSKPGEQVYSYNGLKLNWPGGNGGSTAFYSDHDAQEEFQVVTDAAPAEVSVGGLYMNQITKSGSNEWHGLAAVYYLTSAFQAQTQLPTFKGALVNAGLPFAMARDVAVNAGGPIIKDRWWIFGGWRNYDVRQNVLAVRTKAGTPTFDDNHQSNGTMRNDVQLTQKQRASLIWLWNEQNRFYRRGTTYSFTDAQAAQRQIEPAYVLQGQWTYAPTPNLAIEARFGYMKLHFPLDYEPGVTPATLSVADLSLSTLTGAAQNATLDITGTTRAAANISYFKGNLLGVHNFKAGYDFDYSSKQDYTSINGNIDVYFNNGNPFEVYAYDTPLHARSAFREGAFFLQDAWTLNRRITITLGVRYENFVTWLPAQSSPAAGFSTLFPNRTFSRSPNAVDWNTFVPRVGVSWDPKGDSRSVFHAGYNRFTLSEGTRLAEALNPNSSSYQIYKWSDLNGDGVPQQNEYLTPANFLGSVGGIVTTVDPHLKRPYSDQVNAGYERQILGDLRIGVSYYYRTTKQQISRINAAIPASAYFPISVTDPLNSQPLTIFNLTQSYVGKAAYVLTNEPELDNNHYNGVEVSAVKRLTRHWQVLAGLTVQRTRGTYGSALTDNFNDPNLEINRKNALLDQDATYLVKISGTYQAPWGVWFSPNYQYYTGYPLLPTNVFTGLNQGSETISLLPRGTIRLPNISVLNLRISRPTKFLEGRIGLEPIADLLNLTNSEPITAENTSYGANYLRPTNLVNPFVARFALRLTF